MAHVRPTSVTGGVATGDDPWRLRWSAIFGGAFVALGLWALLYIFGMAVGLVSVDAASGRFDFPGLFAGIWAVISPLVALFVGGFVAARTAGPQDWMSGGIHGVVLWGLTTALGMVLLWVVISALVAGAVALGQGLGGAVQQANGQQIAGGISERLLDPVNQRLQQAGHPTLTAEELEASVQQVVEGVAQGEPMNRDSIVQALVENTDLQEQDVQEIAGDIEQEVQQSSQDLQQTAAQATETVGTAMWGLFFAHLLGLLAAVAGALLGTSQGQRMRAAEHNPVQR